MIVIRLTPLEARTLEMAAASISEDIDEYALSGAEKRAYSRALAKLRSPEPQEGKDG